MPYTFKKVIAIGLLGLAGLLSACGGGGGGSAPVNDVPIARDDGFTLDVSTDLIGSVGGNDTLSKDGGNVWRLKDSPNYGTIVFNDTGHFTYTPEDVNVVSDSFTYTLVDANADASLATVYISILPILSLNDAFIESQWHLKSIEALAPDAVRYDLAQSSYAQGFTGNGVEVAIIDGGLEIKHEDLIDNVVLNGSYNFINKSNDPTLTTDSGIHGTAVAGLVGARGGNEIGVWGVAPSAELKGFNFISSSQDLDIELASHGYEPIANNFVGLSVGSVDVFNKSYGRNPAYVPAGLALEEAQQLISIMGWGTQYLRDGKGAIYSKAGGNEFNTEFCALFNSTNCIKYVSCTQANNRGVTCFNVNMETENTTPYQMVIGAYNSNNVRANYSNTGSALWLSAPGGESVGLTTTDQSTCSNGYNQALTSADQNCNYVSTFAGTSAATPIVSGAVALLLEANPDLTWRDVKHILATTARQLDSGLAAKTMTIGASSVTLEQGWVTNKAIPAFKYSNAYGFGAVNVDAAITMALDWKNNSTHLAYLPSETYGPNNLATDNIIPDFSAAGLTKVQTVTKNLITESVQLTLSIQAIGSTTDGDTSHNIDISDYQIILESPSGTQSILLTPFNAYQAHYDMTDLTLISHAFYGEPMITNANNANWKLIIRDVDNTYIDSGSGEGKLVKWSLQFYGH